MVVKYFMKEKSHTVKIQTDDILNRIKSTMLNQRDSKGYTLELDVYNNTYSPLQITKISPNTISTGMNVYIVSRM